MKWMRACVCLILAVFVFWALDSSHGIIPPLGKLFNPFAGFWQNNSKSDRIVEEIVLPELENSVQVVWDARRVPHIFAQNDHDLYFAQGYVTARDRLWQMEFQTWAVSGRLSEVVGKRALEYDRFQRRLGMLYAAENAVKGFAGHPESKAILLAYKDGVNAYIRRLKKKNLPLEYKLLNYSPESWTELKSGLLLKYMAFDLTGNSADSQMTRTREAVGKEAMNKLYPLTPPFLNPIIPAGTRWDFSPQVPIKPEEELLLSGQYPGEQDAESRHWLGSNNWAVSGKLTESGYPILCNDPHLGLNLPSLWYEIQLVSPEVNVYGVSLPGAPTVIIGFNESIAWGLTNTESDAMDWYKIKFRDSTREEYFYEGEWRKTGVRAEEIKVRGGKTVRDNVYYTHHGPVVYCEGEEPFASRIPVGAAMRWTGHDPSDELMTLNRLNRASNYEEYRQALEFYDCPGQNFIFADVNGDIALWHNGKFPLRWEGQGRFILDGSRSEDEWKGLIPREHLPHVKNPERNFVSSANQKPTDSLFPYYLGWDYATFDRGARVNEFLSGMKGITPQDMMRMQLDTVSIRDRMLAPLLLQHLQKEELSPDEKRSFDELEAWNFEYRVESIAPTIFNAFWEDLYRKIWKDDTGPESAALSSPTSEVTLDLIINQPHSPYFDDKTTPETETLSELFSKAFQDSTKKLVEKFGPFGKSWRWGKTRGTDIVHLAKIPALSRNNLETDGISRAINAISSQFGPSWRMVVSLGPGVKAWGIYPGGQSGNPGSKFYDNFVDSWVEGKTYELLYLKSPEDANPAVVGRTTLRGGK